MLFFLSRLHEDKNIIDVDDDIGDNLEELIHYGLECYGGISLFKEYHHAFIMESMSSD